MTAGSDSRRSFLRQTIVLGAATTTALGASPTYADADVDAGADPDAVREIWLAPGGDDGGPGTRKRPFRTLLRAQQAVRETTGAGQDATVVLRGGSYELTETLRFLPADGGGGVGGGVGGRKVRYRAAPGERPVISGGRTLTAWQVHDSAKGIWRTTVPAGTDTRQLWVNGQRAVRARSGFLPTGFEMNETGYTYAGGSFDFAAWRNLEEVELVSFRRWRSYRCRVDSVQSVATGVELTMQNPCWALAYEDHNPWGNVTIPVWVENAYELLDEPGEWYLDRAAGQLYYKPRADEDLHTAETVIWTASIRNNRAVRNFVDRPDAVWNDGVDNTVEDNPLLDAATIPARAKAIAADAGVQRAYRDLLPGGLPAPPPVEAVCDPQYAGQPPLGPPWTP